MALPVALAIALAVSKQVSDNANRAKEKPAAGGSESGGSTPLVQNMSNNAEKIKESFNQQQPAQQPAQSPEAEKVLQKADGGIIQTPVASGQSFAKGLMNDIIYQIQETESIADLPGIAGSVEQNKYGQLTVSNPPALIMTLLAISSDLAKKVISIEQKLDQASNDAQNMIDQESQAMLNQPIGSPPIEQQQVA